MILEIFMLKYYIIIYCIYHNTVWEQKFLLDWHMLGRENIGGMSIYAKEIKVKQKVCR